MVEALVNLNNLRGLSSLQTPLARTSVEHAGGGSPLLPNSLPCEVLCEKWMLVSMAALRDTDDAASAGDCSEVRALHLRGGRRGD